MNPSHYPHARPERRGLLTPHGQAAYLVAYDAVVSHWPVPVESRDVPTPYGDTHVLVAGSGTPIVLLHGLSATAASWYAVAGELAARHRVYAVDIMGEPGRSVHDGAAISTTGDLVDWLGAVLAGLELDRPHLAGHSFGGHLALRFALATPEHVDRLVLMEPARAFAELLPEFVANALAGLQETPERIREQFLHAVPDSEAGRAYAELLTLGTVSFPASPQVTPELPDPRELERLSPPTLLLLGGRSEIHDTRLAEQTAYRAVPGIVCRTLPEAAHALPTEVPDLVDAELRSFLGRP